METILSAIDSAPYFPKYVLCDHATQNRQFFDRCNILLPSARKQKQFWNSNPSIIPHFIFFFSFLKNAPNNPVRAI